MNNQNKQLIESLKIAQNKLALMVELAEKDQVRVIDQLYIADVERMLACAKLHCATRLAKGDK